MRHGVLVQLGVLASALALASGCKIFGGKPAPEGLSGVNSVGKGAEEWKDPKGGVWRINELRPLDWEDAEEYCQKQAAAFKKRWRLPSPEELKAARAAGISTKANKAFGWIKLGNTWSAAWETNVSEDIAGTYVDMNTGEVFSTLYDDLEHTTVCVRTDGGGSQWSDGAGRQYYYLDVKMPWETAEVSCSELARRKHEAWRLPTSEELDAAIKAGIQTEKNAAFGRDYLTFTWSSQVAPILDSEQAFATDLRNGRSHLVDVDEELAVVCVMGNDAPAQAAQK